MDILAKILENHPAAVETTTNQPAKTMFFTMSCSISKPQFGLQTVTGIFIPLTQARRDLLLLPNFVDYCYLAYCTIVEISI